MVVQAGAPVFCDDSPTILIEFSPDYRFLASCTSNGVFSIRNTSTLACEFSTLSVRGRMTSLTFSPDGRRVAVVCWDSRVYMFQHGVDGWEAIDIGCPDVERVSTSTPAALGTWLDSNTVSLWRATKRRCAEFGELLELTYCFGFHDASLRCSWL